MAFPLLGNIAKRYLHVCAPATSTCSERVFGKGGRIVTPFRASLKPDTVKMLIFLSMNLSTFLLIEGLHLILCYFKFLN